MAAVLWSTDFLPLLLFLPSICTGGTVMSRGSAAHLSDVEINVDFSTNDVISNFNTYNFYSYVVAYSPHVMGIILQI